LNKFFGEKVKFGKFPTESEKFSEIGRKSETGGNASLPQGGWTPLDVAIKNWRVWILGRADIDLDRVFLRF